MVSNLVILSQSSVRANNWGTTAGDSLTLDLSDSVESIELQSKDNLTSIAYPVSTTNAPTKSPYRLAIPLKRVEETITITGTLSDTESGDSAVVKMKQLMAMHEGGGNCVLTWRNLKFQTTSPGGSYYWIPQAVLITSLTFTDSWETIAGTDTGKMDAGLTPSTSSFGKIPYTMILIIAKERGT